MIDPYAYLSNIADELWDLHERTSGKPSDQAEAMYNALENDYLEPFRRQKVQSNTQKYAQLTQQLQADLNDIDATIQRINGMQNTVQQVAEYAAVFDQIVAVAAKLA